MNTNHKELGKRRWTEQDLANRRKTNATKVKIAARLRGETVMTLDWIAERLGMGCRSYRGQLLERIAVSTIAGAAGLTPF